MITHLQVVAVKGMLRSGCSNDEIVEYLERSEKWCDEHKFKERRDYVKTKKV